MLRSFFTMSSKKSSVSCRIDMRRYSNRSWGTCRDRDRSIPASAVPATVQRNCRPRAWERGSFNIRSTCACNTAGLCSVLRSAQRISSSSGIVDHKEVRQARGQGVIAIVPRRPEPGKMPHSAKFRCAPAVRPGVSIRKRKSGETSIACNATPMESSKLDPLFPRLGVKIEIRLQFLGGHRTAERPALQS